MNWKIYSEEKPKPFKQVIAYNPKWKVNKIVLGYLDDSDIDEKFNYVLLIPQIKNFILLKVNRRDGLTLKNWLKMLD